MADALLYLHRLCTLCNILQEISKKLGGSHPCLSWTPPEREPVCLDDDDDFDVADDVSPAPSHFSSTRAMQGSAIQDEPERQIRGTKRARSNTSDSTTDVQGADALLQLAAAASSARDVEMRSKQHRPSGPPTPSSPYGGMDALLSAAQASGGSGTLSRQRSGSEARSPRSAIPSSAVGAPPQQPVAWHNDASSGFDSTYTAQSSTNSTRAASRPQAAPRPDTAPVADAAQADAAAPRFHLTPRTTGMQPSAPAPVSGHAQVAQVAASSSGLPAGKYKVVTNMDTLPADMKASIQNAMAQHQGGHASLPAYSAAPQHPQLDAGGQPPAHPGAMYMHAQAPTHAPPRHPQYNNFMQPSMHDLYMMHGGGAAGYGGQQGMMQAQQPTHPGFHSMSYSGMQQPQQQAVQGHYTHSPHMQGMHMGQVSFQPVGHAHGGFMPPHQMYAAAHAQGHHTSM